MSDQSPRCNVCIDASSRIHNHFAKCAADDDGAVGIEEVSLGTLSELGLRASDCVSCASLRQYIRRLEDTITEWSAAADEDAVCCLRLSGDNTVAVFVDSGSFTLLPYAETISAHNSRTNSNTHTFALPQEPEMDLLKLRSWLKRCDEIHQDECSTDTTAWLATVQPRFLIDVVQGCVVKSPERAAYVTLSYVWGAAKVTVAMKSTIDILMQPGAMRRPELDVPATIADAMLLAELLDQRFLWVDSFCIVQDDYDTKAAELHSMGDFYRKSEFTIIAADGDTASHGLPGVPGGSRKRETQPVVEFHPGQPFLIVSEDFPSYHGTVYNTRAWTYQEAVFSRKVLIVSETVSFACRKIALCECVSAPTEHTEKFSMTKYYGSPSLLALTPTMPFAQWPDFVAFFLHVERYNQRRLTYDDDAHDAFAGLIAAMGKHFHGGFHGGLPDLMFDLALLWQPEGRRQPERKNVHLPTWSWVAFECEIDYNLMLDCYDVFWESSAPKVLVSPVVSSYQYTDSSNGFRSVNNIYSQLREQYARTAEKLIRSQTRILKGWKW